MHSKRFWKYGIRIPHDINRKWVRCYSSKVKVKSRDNLCNTTTIARIGITYCVFENLMKIQSELNHRREPDSKQTSLVKMTPTSLALQVYVGYGKCTIQCYFCANDCFETLLQIRMHVNEKQMLSSAVLCDIPYLLAARFVLPVYIGYEKYTIYRVSQKERQRNFES